MDQLGKCQKKRSLLCELLGTSPTNTKKLCQEKQIGEKEEERKRRVLQRERETEREKLPKANSNIWGLRQT